jgi:hypothetical protein
LEIKETESTLSEAVYGENGEPVLVLVEFELYRPFFPARILDDFMEAFV